MDLSPKRPVRQLTTDYSSFSLFDSDGKKKLDELTMANCNPGISEGEMLKEAEKDTVPEMTTGLERKLVVADCMFCNTCQTQFADREEQLDHYKCDWHRYNLHLRLKGLPCVTEETFEATAGDVSSISGSDDEDENDKEKKGDIPVVETPDIETENKVVLLERKFHKVFFKTGEGELISLYRCLLHHKKTPLYESDRLVTAVKAIQNKSKWVILMVSSGHFAGAVFQGKEVVQHKTFHRYTIRSKRGFAQSTRDSQGNAPKSGGASLRRYNEAALAQEVQELLSNWTEHLRTADYVFVRIPVANRTMFYGGKTPSLKKDDPRIRVIPFATRRPTFSETKRVHQMLSSVECYGQEAQVGDMIPLSPRRMYNNDTGELEVVLESARQGKKMNKKLTPDKSQPEMTATDNRMASEERLTESSQAEEESQQNETVVMDLIESMETIDFSDLKEFDSSIERKPRKKKKKDLFINEAAVQNSSEDDPASPWRNPLFTACKTGNLQLLQSLIKEICQCELQASSTLSCEPQQDESTSTEKCQQDSVKGTTNDSAQTTLESIGLLLDTSNSTSIHQSSCPVVQIVNTPLGEAGTTFLHVAAKEEHPTVVTELLYAGADPAVKDKAGKLPYYLGDMEVRNTLRRFMANFPDAYDYAKAQVPSPLTAEMEAGKKQKTAEKKKAKKKAAQERNKEKKAAEAKEREENREKERFLALSDREKRALAAERRLLQQHSQQGGSKPVLSRCWQCGTDITGKIPFEYSDYKFCTTKCLREHRSKTTS